MIRLEEHVQVDARFIGLEFLERPGNDRARKTRLVRAEGESFGVCKCGRGLLCCRRRRGRFFPTADHHHVRRNCNADRRSKAVDAISRDRKPQSGVKQIAGIRADIGELQSLNRAVVGAFERAFVFEVECATPVFCEAAVECEAHARILRVALRSERLVARVRELRDAQPIVQLKRGHAEVFERGDLYRGASGEFVSRRQELDINLVIIHAQARLLRRHRRLVRYRGKKQEKKDNS